MTTVPIPSAALTVGRQGNYAGAISRLAAFAADVGASWGLYTLGVALLNAALKLLTGHSFTLSNHQLPAFIVLTIWEFLYFTYQWAVSGKTFGMAILGLQVVTSQGAPISGRQAVLRTLGLGFTL
ncbi:MAG TPA: RDD family protein, partial [Acidimicrobiales bacterium]|nr:RDD family protein [Acidimicrobiales bacterium]